MTERRTPRQQRSEQTRAKVLESARWAIVQYGRDRFNTGQVAEHADVSIGTVYRYFQDRAALIEAVLPAYPLADVEHNHEWGCMVCGRSIKEHLHLRPAERFTVPD